MSIGNNPVNVTYGSYAFANLGTPYVSRSQEMVYYGQKWCQVTRLTLNGDILGTYNEINVARSTLLAGFANDFQDLKIKEDGTTIAVFPKCIVKSIDADSFNHGKQSYTITLESYEEENFIGTYGVLEPVDSFSYAEGDDGFVDIAHKVSARAIKTGDPAALAQALNYVDNLTGFNSVKITPEFIGGISASNAILTNVSRAIDRVNSSYSVEESYKVQTGDVYGVPIKAGFLTTIDTSFQSGFESDYTTVGIKYSLQGDKHASASSLRAAIPTTGTLYSIAFDSYGQNGLAQRPRNYSIDDSALTTKEISLSCDFTDNSFADIDDSYYDFTSSVNTDNVTNITTISLNGHFKAIGPVKEKYAAVSGYFYDKIVPNNGATGFLYGLAEKIYTDSRSKYLRDNVNYTLQRIPDSISVTNNDLNGTISLQGRFTDKDSLKMDQPHERHFNTITYGVNVTPSINTYAARASCNKNGLYGIYDLNSATRQSTTINGNFVATGIERAGNGTIIYPDPQIAAFIDTLKANFVLAEGKDLIVDDESVSKVPFPKCSYDYSAGYNTSNPTLI